MSLRRSTAIFAAFACLCLASARLSAITVDQVDNFNADLAGWQSGIGLERIDTGGPGGDGDAFLLNQSFGGSGNSGKWVVRNELQWIGDYLAAGVTAISMDVKNLGTTDFTLRLAMGNSSFPGIDNENPNGDWMVTTLGINVPAMSDWTNVTFQLGESDFSGRPYENIIDSVLGFRIVNSLTTANPGKGDEVAALLGVDNITALAGGTSIPGDFNGVDGVTGADLAKWQGDFLLNGESDADGDGDSDGNDFLIWQRNLGMGTVVAAASAVPEPSSFALVLPLAALVARGRRRRLPTCRS
jgi:hypothetical protein